MERDSCSGSGTVYPVECMVFNIHLLRMLDYFYLSQTVSDPYSEFLAMHWAKGVTWEAYVLSIIHFAQKHRYFQKLEEHGHQGSAPVNMDADQVFMNQPTLQITTLASSCTYRANSYRSSRFAQALCSPHHC